ncbi:proton-conducting transporter transmembrane domain-containing protein [Kineococcus sp. SYSU DK004]|uniref:proton-conducting transporter transmembrane domain-containing protein n=1 Tax=Kineococcus sp. SYSU DK004 TaxID=3383125 RepID=UPI003D7F0EB2
MSGQPLALLPEALLLAGAVACLLTGSFLPRHRQRVARHVAVAALLGCAGAAGGQLLGVLPAGGAAYEQSFAVDAPSSAVRLVVAAAVLLVVAQGVDELTGAERESETCSLLLLGALGALVLAAATDLLVLTVGFLLTSVPLYGLLGLARTATSAESAVKVYLLGALGGVTLLLGVTLLTALAGGSRYADLAAGLRAAPAAVVAVAVVAVLAGLVFEAGAVPLHQWVPDAAQAGSATAAAWLTTVPKVGALVAVHRFTEVLAAGSAVDVRLVVAVLAALSMTLGNLAAFTQTDPRRLLGWSAVSQVGYLLLPAAVAGAAGAATASLVLYLAAYAVTNLAAFAVVAAVPARRTLDAYRGMAGARPLLAAALLVSLLGLVGTPPTAVFAGKLAVFTAAWDGGAAWLVVVAAVNTVASLFYYLRWLGRAYGPAEVSGAAVPVRPWAARAAVTAACASLVAGPAAGLLSGVLGPALQAPPAGW